MKKRTFSAEFKAKVVLETIRGEKEINQLATQHQISPNLIRNWKKEFLDNASAVFDNKREDNLREKLKESRDSEDELMKKIGQLTMQVDWLKKKSEESFGSEWESKFSPKPQDI